MTGEGATTGNRLILRFFFRSDSTRVNVSIATICRITTDAVILFRIRPRAANLERMAVSLARGPVAAGRPRPSR
ncbi:hypothetical protein GCM10022275_15320 [Tessaracoccus defluvii]